MSGEVEGLPERDREFREFRAAIERYRDVPTPEAKARVESAIQVVGHDLIAKYREQPFPFEFFVQRVYEYLELTPVEFYVLLASAHLIDAPEDFTPPKILRFMLDRFVGYEEEEEDEEPEP